MYAVYYKYTYTYIIHVSSIDVFHSRWPITVVGESQGSQRSEIPTGKLTWLWNIAIEIVDLFNVGDLSIYLCNSLPEDISIGLSQYHPLSATNHY